ncbi:hypothetical protein D3C78_1174780 [compost metagenome]
MGFAACADGCRDRRQVQAMTTKRRQQHTGQGIAGNDRTGWRLIAVIAQHGDTRDKLPGQRHHHQRQADAQQRMPAERWQGPDRRRQADHQCRTIQFATEDSDAHPTHQYRQYRIARRHALEQQVSDKHR